MKLMKPEMILYAAFANLAYLVVFLTELFILATQPGARLEALYSAEVLLSIVIYLGWIEMGRRFKNRLMVEISMVAVFLIPIAGILAIILSSTGLYTPFFAIASGIISGLVLTIFGFSLLRLK